MSVTVTTSVSDFMDRYVESQGRTQPVFSTAEETDLHLALAQFQLNATQLEQIDTLLEALEVMRTMVATGSLASASLDAIELSIQTLLQGATSSPVSAPAPAAAQPQPLPPEVQTFSDKYLTSSYLQDAAVWPGSDTGLQADLSQLALSSLEMAVATQYMYRIADQRRYLATIDTALAGPDGVLYATPSEPGYAAYLNYTQVRAATAAGIEDDVSLVQQLLQGMVNVTNAAFDPVPWSAQLTDPKTAVPPSGDLDRTRFEWSEDKFRQGELGSQARMIEGQVVQLNALLATKSPPLTSDQIIRYTTQRTDLRHTLALVSAEYSALQARMKYDAAIIAGTSMSANGSLRVDLDADFARLQLTGFAPRPVDTGSPEPVPVSTLETALATDQAAYAALAGTSAPPSPPLNLKLVEGYIDRITYLVDVPTGTRLTDEQTDEVWLLWAHREALRREQQAMNAELAALKNRIDYAQAALAGSSPYTTSQWNTLTLAVGAAHATRLAQEAVPPVSGAIATPPPDMVAWKLSGMNPRHVDITRIENFLLTEEPINWAHDESPNDWVYAQLAAFDTYKGRVADDSMTAVTAKAAVQQAISSGVTGISLTSAQRQLAALNALMALYPSFSEDATMGYNNAEAARTVTDATQVNAVLASVEGSLDSIRPDDYLAAEQKMLLADANYDYHYPNGGMDPRAAYLQALSTLAVNVYNQKRYAYLAANETDDNTRQAELNALAIYEAAYPDLLTTALASYFDAAYAAASAGEWPRTVSTSLSPQQKADEVTAYYGGNVYPVIDPLQTTILPASVT